MGIIRMAWRNVGRNRRRTGVTVAAMTVALVFCILISGLMQGMFVNMERSVTDLEIGDVQIHTVNYLNNPSIYETVKSVDELIQGLEEAGFSASPRLVGAGLAAARESSAGAQLRGVNVRLDARVGSLAQNVRDGQWLDPSDSLGAVVGSRLARTLDVAVGDELIVLSQATDGSMANDLFTVRGILGIVGDSIDRSGVLVNESTFREFFVMPEGAHEIIVRRPAGVELAGATETVRGIASGLDVQSWRELVPVLASYVDIAGQAIYVLFAIFYVVVGILILNAMLMAVFERIREFGVLKALGVEPGRVLSLIFMESVVQTGVAIAVGLTLAWPTLRYLEQTGIGLAGMSGTQIMGMTFGETMFAVVTPATVVTPVLFLVVIVLLSVLYPALKAARISPVEAMRYQ